MWETGLLQAKAKGGLPTISDYLDTFYNPYGRFRTLGEPEPSTTPRGEILFYAGNNSAIFPVTTKQGEISLKCYIKNGLYIDEIYSYLSHRDDPLLTPAHLLKEEIFVYDVFGNGNYHDVVSAEWVDGVTLETALRRAARNDGFTFTELSAAFEYMARQLLDREWAHGDLKPENLIVRPDGSLCLIDYDAMFIPKLTGRRTLEIGTPPYQHPSRDETIFDRWMDDYSIAVITVSLRALALDPRLYERYNRTDNIILYPADILGEGSEAYTEVLRLFAGCGDHMSYNLALLLQTRSPRIENLAELLHSSPIVYPSPKISPMKVADVVSSYFEDDTYPKPFSKNGLWGYCNEEEQDVIPAIYETVCEFIDGVAVVQINGIWQTIDRTGNVVLDCSMLDTVKPFSEGLAPVCKNGKWGYMTLKGSITVEPIFEMAGIVREGYAVVKLGGKYGYIDRNGKIVINPIYDYATGFRQGRAMVSIGGETFEIGINVTGK